MTKSALSEDLRYHAINHADCRIIVPAILEIGIHLAHKV